MDIQKSSFLSINQLADRMYGSKTVKDGKEKTTEGLSFKDILEQKSEGTDVLKFSKHASSRLLDRGITLSDEQLRRLESGAGKAQKKGIKDSLVIVDDLAFIVNVPNKTVITAMDSTQSDDNIFTNINGAVIM